MGVKKDILRGVAVGVIIACTLLCYVFLNLKDRSVTDYGERVLRLMYNFDTLDDVHENYDALRAMSSPELAAQMDFDNGVWVGTYYYDTGFAPTRVDIKYTRPGFIVFALKNENVYEDTLWVFQYEVSHGKLVSMKEYRMAAHRRGDKGGVI